MYTSTITRDLQFFGNFKNGKVVGKFWLGLLNNGYLHGKVNEDGMATGNDIAYIYPDGVTALKGNFVDKYMTEAYEVQVETYRCNMKSGTLEVEAYSKPKSPLKYMYDPCTNTSFGGGPNTVSDPYEQKYLTLKDSNVVGSGSGVFAKTDLPKDRVASYYSLYLYRENDQVDLFNAACSQNTSKDNEYRRQCNKYTIDLDTYDGTIALPPNLDIDPLPTLGPKVNHHFSLNNSIYMETEHPIWGLIIGVYPQVDLRKGEELFTYYDYERTGQKDFPNDYPWYWEAKIQSDREKRLSKS